MKPVIKEWEGKGTHDGHRDSEGLRGLAKEQLASVGQTPC